MKITSIGASKQLLATLWRRLGATPKLMLSWFLLLSCASAAAESAEFDEQPGVSEARLARDGLDAGIQNVGQHSSSVAKGAPSHEEPAGEEISRETHGSKEPRIAESADCPQRPRAYILAADSSAAARASDELTGAGFAPEPLPLDRSPSTLRGLIFIGSSASAREDYAEYMSEFASDLYHFVDRANLLVQMRQSPSAEHAPKFLPTTQEAIRGKVKVASIQVATDSPLMSGDWLDAPPDALLEMAQSAFVQYSGFAVLAKVANPDDAALLLEGAYGQGRIVLSALPLDSPSLKSSMQKRTARWLTNLRQETVAVCERNTAALNLPGSAVSGRFTQGSSMLAVLPDTQAYSLRIPGLFMLQTAWLANVAPQLDIRYAIHLGDIVNNNTPLEWQRAADSMALLHGKVPYALVPGNHDYGPSGDASTRETLLNDYFSFDRAASEPGFGGAFEDGKLDNTYHLLSIGGRNLLIIALEWGPRPEVIEWANSVASRFSDREAVLVTHAYLNNNDRRYDHTDSDHPQQYNPYNYRTPGGVSDGEELWQQLVRRHRFIMTLNGHVLGDGAGYLASTTDKGNTCHQMLSNYQMREQGGQAYLRLVEFMPNGTAVKVHSYSPLLDKFLKSAEHQFEFELD